MAQKEGKTLYLPLWVTEILTTEAERYGGPGIIAAASIIHFSRMPSREKISVLKQYRAIEVEDAYRDEAVAGPLNEEPQRTGRKHKGSTGG